MFSDSWAGLPIEQITDGTSTTMYLGEIAGRPAWWTKGGVCGLVNHGVPTMCNKTPLKGWYGSNPGGCWACWQNKGKCWHGSSFDGLSKPANSTATKIVPVCFFNCTNETGFNVVFSFHPGSGGVCMCDGSAHMLSENVSVLVMHSFMTPRGREAVSDSVVTQ